MKNFNVYTVAESKVLGKSKTFLETVQAPTLADAYKGYRKGWVEISEATAPEKTEFEQNAGLGRIGVSRDSAYYHLNGQKFPIVEKVGSRISLNIDGQTTDFFNCEVSVCTVRGWFGYTLAKTWGLI